jgi:hypothetical protein
MQRRLTIDQEIAFALQHIAALDARMVVTTRAFSA